MGFAIEFFASTLASTMGLVALTIPLALGPLELSHVLIYYGISALVFPLAVAVPKALGLAASTAAKIHAHLWRGDETTRT